MTYRLLLVSLLLCLGLSVRAQAQTAEGDSAIGTILSVEGTATVTPPGGKPAPAAVNARLHLNDIIETGAQSRVFVSFADDTQFTLSQNTKLTVDKYVYNPDDDTDNKAHYSVLAGAFEYVSGLIAKRNNPDVGIETPVGSIGIRGTDLWGGSLDGAYGVYVHEGRVNVKNDAGQVQVDEGTGTSAKSRKDAPSTARKWANEQIASIRESVALKQRELIDQRRQKIIQARLEMWEQKRTQMKAQVQQLLAEKKETMKKSITFSLENGKTQTKTMLQNEARQIAEAKHAAILALRDKIKALKDEIEQTPKGPSRRALWEQRNQMIADIKQKRDNFRNDVHAEMQPIIERSHEALRQSMQTMIANLHGQMKQEIETAIKGMRADAKADVRNQMQQVLDQSKQDLQGQMQQVRAEAEAQTQQVEQEAAQREAAEKPGAEEQ
jgi:hypothetical protein